MRQPSADPSQGPPPSSILPDFHLLCMESKFSDAFNEAQAKHFPELREHTTLTVHNCGLKNLPKDLGTDAVVSPANSYGRLDGAFDDALARAYGPSGDYGWITRKAQRVLYDKWRGFSPPGTCTVVRLDHDGGTTGRDWTGRTYHLNPWNTEYLLLCPTMRVPQDVRWDREVAFECIWSLLCAVDEHNRALRARDVNFRGGEKEIKSVLMTPLGTGVGRISPKKWAEQTVMAMKQYVEAVQNPQTWSSLEWGKILEDHHEVVATHDG